MLIVPAQPEVEPVSFSVPAPASVNPLVPSSTDEIVLLFCALMTASELPKLSVPLVMPAEPLRISPAGFVPSPIVSV